MICNFFIAFSFLNFACFLMLAFDLGLNADPATLPAIKSNALSCMSGGCHNVTHDIANLKTAKFCKDPH
jgi:hypothetical protein